MSSAVTIAVPCEVFDVVLSADDDGPTDLERALLLFLAASPRARLNDVLSFLGLGERMAMDLVTQLWQAGYILVDAVHGAISLERRWLEPVRGGVWDEMRSARRLSETVSLMRELVSGQIVEDIASRASPQPGSDGPILVSSSLAESATQVGLAGIAMANLKPGSPLRARARSVRAEVSARPGRGLNWLSMEFEAKVDPHVQGSLTLRAVPGDHITRARLGPGIAKSLTAWALDNPEHPAVAQLLREAASEGLRHGVSLPGRIEVLTGQIGAGMEAPKDHAHDAVRWRGELAALTAEVEALEAARGKTVLRIGAEAGPAAVLGLAAAFDHQLILASPAIDYEGLQILSTTAVARLKALPMDASMVVLWGGQGQRQLPENALSYLHRTARETADASSARFMSSPRASRIAAALAVMDGRRVLYASASPLLAGGDGRAPDEPASFDYLLDITAPSPSPIPRRVLEIARERAPDFDIASQIDLKPWQPVASPSAATWFDPASMIGDDGPLDADRPDVEPGDDGSQEVGGLDVEGVVAAAPDVVAQANETLTLKAALHDLRQHCLALSDRAARAGSTVDIICDGALYQQALDMVADEAIVSLEGALWLGFGRDHTAPYGVPLHRTLAEAVEGRARRGLATVALIDPGPPRPGGKGVARAVGVDLTALRELSGQYPGLVAVHETPGLTGHILCGETRLLAAPGGLASPPVAQAGRLASRLVGVAVADPELCASFRLALANRWPALKAHLTAPTRRRAPAVDAAPLAVSSLVEAWRAASTGQRRARLLHEMRGGRSEGDVAVAAKALLELTERGEDTSTRELRLDTLAVAAVHGSEPLSAVARTELAVDAWRSRRWQEAAVLLTAPGLADGLCPIPAELALAAAAVNLGLIAPQLPGLLEHADEDGWVAGVALAAQAVLFNGDEQGLSESLEIKIDDEIPAGAQPLAAVALAAAQYWNQTMLPIDPATVLAIARKDDLEADLRAAARAFAKAFGDVVDREYNNAMLGRVVPRVYSDVSGFKPLAARIGADGAAPWPALLEGLVASLGRDRVNVTELADEFLETSRRRFGTPQDEPVFSGRGKGAGIHETLRDVIRRAVALRDAIQEAQAAPARAASLPMAALLKVLRDALPSLGAMAAALPAASAAAPVLGAFHDRLAEMIGGRP